MSTLDSHLETILSDDPPRSSDPMSESIVDAASSADPSAPGPGDSFLHILAQGSGFFSAFDPKNCAEAERKDREPATGEMAMAEGPGSMIGPYELIQQIGEGGMGTVFLAQQETPIRRKVALKVIKPSMNTRRVLARFEAERQALAMMDHPNIARVLDVGATATGRPYCVMELVKGIPITEYCDRNQLTPSERLELFIPVCHAIQHAHQKGIIHRDIKPSNVMVTLHDGNPMPKVIDFGVAKAIEQKLTDKTMFTEFGAVIGTLEYMSPEQAELGALDIDTRSDIYSLGVLLYELLTGSTPLERKKLHEAAHGEVLRRIREEEPARPSTRLSDSSDHLTAISARRNMEPTRLTRLVRGDLDWIVMKCLEKDRARRYETANGFASDLQRYLRGDPVEACPPSASYKLRKFTSKHRGAFATAGAFALILMAATAISVSFAYRADRQRDLATIATELAKYQQARAEEREEMAIRVVQRFRDVVAAHPELKYSLGLEALRKQLLKEPLAFFRDLRNQLQVDAGTRPESFARLARATEDLGLLIEEIGDQEDAMIAYDDALAIFLKLAAAKPHSWELQRDLAKCHYRLGCLMRKTARLAEAQKAFAAAEVIFEKLAATHTGNAEFLRYAALSQCNIGRILSSLGKSTAMQAFEPALVDFKRLAADNPDSAEAQRDLADCHYSIGLLQIDLSHRDAALNSHQAALAIRQRLNEANPDSTDLQRDLARSHHHIGVLLRDKGKETESLTAFQQAMAKSQTLVAAYPSVTEFQSDLAECHYHLGLLQKQRNEPTDAMSNLQAALIIFDELITANPAVIRFQTGLADCHSAIGSIHAERQQPAEAMRSHRMALELREKVFQTNRNLIDLLDDLAESHQKIAELLKLDRQPDAAMTSYAAALRIQTVLARDHPMITDFRRGLANTHFAVGNLLKDEGDWAGARKPFETALAIRKKLAEDYPETTEFRSEVANTYVTLGNALKAVESRQEAFAAYNEALAIRTSLARSKPTPVVLTKLAKLHTLIARTHMAMYQDSDAKHHFDSTVGIYRELLRRDPRSAEYASALAASLRDSANLELRANRLGRAADRQRQAVVWQWTALTSGPSDPESSELMVAQWNNLLTTVVALARTITSFCSSFR